MTILFCWQNKIWMVPTWGGGGGGGGWTRLGGHARCGYFEIKNSSTSETSQKKQRMKLGPTGRGYNINDYICIEIKLRTPKEFAD